MILLAVDTSGPVAGVALMQEDALRYEAMAVNHFTHSESMMPMIEECFLRTGLSIDDVDLFAVTVGPGSFTGVRIGVTAVKAMAHARGKKIVGVDSLQALAMSCAASRHIICPILDARAGQVYGAAFHTADENALPEYLMQDDAIKLGEYLDKLSVLGETFYFVGDGVPVYAQKIKETLGEKAHMALPALQTLRPAMVAQIAAMQKDSAVDYLSLQPKYLRAPQAERERAAREKQNG